MFCGCGRFRFIVRVVYRGGGGGGCTSTNFICFVLNWVKIEAFPNHAASKIWKNLSVDQKYQRRRSAGQADFSKIAQRKQKFIKHVNCVFI